MNVIASCCAVEEFVTIKRLLRENPEADENGPLLIVMVKTLIKNAKQSDAEMILLEADREASYAIRA